MSKEPWVYGRVEGKNAFLAGIVEGMTETRLADILNKFNRTGASVNMDTDVFALEEHGIDEIKMSIKRRIDGGGLEFIDYRNREKYRPNRHKADALEFVKQDISFEGVILDLLSVGVTINEIVEGEVKTYCRDLRWYFGDAVTIYRLEDREELLKAYSWIVFKACIIEFQYNAVLLIVGSSD